MVLFCYIIGLLVVFAVVVLVFAGFTNCIRWFTNVFAPTLGFRVEGLVLVMISGTYVLFSLRITGSYVVTRRTRAVSVPSRGRLAPYRCRTVAVLHRIAAASWPHRVRPRAVPLGHFTVIVPCCGRNAPKIFDSHSMSPPRSGLGRSCTRSVFI